MKKLHNSHGLKEAAVSVSKGLYFQEKKDFINSKEMFQQGIEKMKKILLSNDSNNKETIFEYVDYFNLV